MNRENIDLSKGDGESALEVTFDKFNNLMTSEKRLAAANKLKGRRNALNELAEDDVNAGPAAFAVRRDEVNLLMASGVEAELEASYAEFRDAVAKGNTHNGNQDDATGVWEFAANQENLVTIVRRDRNVQKWATSTSSEPMPVTSASVENNVTKAVTDGEELTLETNEQASARVARANGVSPDSPNVNNIVRVDQSPAVDEPLTFNVQGDKKAPPAEIPTLHDVLVPGTGGVTVNNFTQEEQDRARIDWYKNNKTELVDELLQRDNVVAKSEVTVNNFTQEEQDKAKAEWIKNNSEEYVADLNRKAKREEKFLVNQETPRTYASSIDIDLSDPNLGTKSEVFTQQEMKRNPTEGEIEAYKQGLEDGARNIEKATNALEARNEKAKEGLLVMGLTGITKGLDVYRNMKPRNKLAVGLFFAGASVATGGVTSVISKGLATGSYARGFYEQILKAETEKGNEVNKKWLAARSLAYGAVMAVGTSMLLSEVASHFDGNGMLDAAKEKLSSMKDGLKSLFGFATDSAVEAVPTPAPAPIVTAMDDGVVTTGPGSGITYNVLSSAYEIQPGDNLTKIISSKVIDNIPGFEGMSSLQKENVVQNLLSLARGSGNDELLNTIRQFTNPDLIMPGQTVDLEAIKKAITTIEVTNFNGQTLLEHAKTLKI